MFRREDGPVLSVLIKNVSGYVSIAFAILDLQRFQACLEPFCIIVWRGKEERWSREEM